ITSLYVILCIFVYQNMYTMAIVETTSRQFRERQKDFFELADKGEKVIIRRGRKQTYVLTPVSDDDLYFSPEMIQRIKEAQEEIKEGKSISFNSVDEMDKYFQSL
ncbi:hypothetical protein, partial [Arcticibacter sp.]|uniref:hypothetical protein n=1 Tax=Arcticibacter sp. TaxID=1872630 RepID=UPI00388ECC46